MKKQIRKNVFETNSSSMHSLTIATQDEFDKWKNGELFYDEYKECFTSKDEILSDFKMNDIEYDETNKEHVKIRVNEFGYYTYKEWNDYNYNEYETYSRYFTSPSGDQMVAFGCYGNNY